MRDWSICCDALSLIASLAVVADDGDGDGDTGDGDAAAAGLGDGEWRLLSDTWLWDWGITKS